MLTILPSSVLALILLSFKESGVAEELVDRISSSDGQAKQLIYLLSDSLKFDRLCSPHSSNFLIVLIESSSLSLVESWC